MFKKLSLVVISTVIIVAVMLSSQMEAFSVKSSDITLVEKSFEKTGASYEYSNINGWAKLNSKFTSLSEMDGIVKRIIKSMEIDDKKVKVSKLDQDNFRQYDAEYEGGNKKVAIVVQSVKNDVDSETYILIDEYLLKGNVNVAEEDEKVKKSYSNLKLEPKIATCLVGTYKGRLNKNEISSIVEEVMKDMDAVKVEGLDEQNLISVSAHTDKIKEYIEMGSEKINLNVALRYSSYDDKTYIWVATPIIATEY